MRARVAVSTLAPNQNPEGIQGVDPAEPPPNGRGEPTDAPLGSSASNQMPEERPTAPSIPVGPRRRGRPRKVQLQAQPETAEDAALEPLYAKVGKLSIYAARAGKDVAAFANELGGLLAAYEELLKRL